MKSTIPAPRANWNEFCATIGVDTEEVATASVVRALHSRLERSNAALDAAIRQLRGEPLPGENCPEPYGCDTGRRTLEKSDRED